MFNLYTFYVVHLFLIITNFPTSTLSDYPRAHSLLFIRTHLSIK